MGRNISTTQYNATESSPLLDATFNSTINLINEYDTNLLSELPENTSDKIPYILEALAQIVADS